MDQHAPLTTIASRKRIVFVNPCGDVSGAEVSLLTLLRGLDQRQFELILIVPEEGKLAEKSRAIGVDVRILPMHAMMIESDILASLRDALASVTELGRIYRLLESLRPSLVHVNSYRIGIPFTLAARRMRIPSLWHMRDIPQSYFKRKLLAALVRFPTRAIAISEAVARSVEIRRQSNSTVVIYNGVELGLYDRATSLSASDDETSDAMLFCSVGQLIPWKGQDQLIRAFARLSERTEVPVRLLIVGDTVKPIWSVSDEYVNYPSYLKQLVRDLGLEQKVTFTGYVDDISQLLFQIDCLVHAPTAPEPFGRVLVEAMAARKPVVAPAHGGIPEIVVDGGTGLLYEPANLNSLTNAMLFAVDNKDQVAEMGKRGFERVCSHFSAHEHVSRISHLYEEIFTSVDQSQK